jgi:hypothetical protein
LKLVTWLLARLTQGERINIAYTIVRDEAINNVHAELFISEIVKDQRNKIVSFVVRD